MHTYVDLYFSPSGVSPLEVADRGAEKRTGLSFSVGRHDRLFEWSSVPEFRERFGKLNAALHGTGVQYRAESVVDDPTFVAPTPWPPPLPGHSREPPAYPADEP